METADTGIGTGLRETLLRGLGIRISPMVGTRFCRLNVKALLVDIAWLLLLLVFLQCSLGPLDVLIVETEAAIFRRRCRFRRPSVLLLWWDASCFA